MQSMYSIDYIYIYTHTWMKLVTKGHVVSLYPYLSLVGFPPGLMVISHLFILLSHYTPEQLLIYPIFPRTVSMIEIWSMVSFSHDIPFWWVCFPPTIFDDMSCYERWRNTCNIYIYEYVYIHRSTSIVSFTRLPTILYPYTHCTYILLIIPH